MTVLKTALKVLLLFFMGFWCATAFVAIGNLGISLAAEVWRWLTT